MGRDKLYPSDMNSILIYNATRLLEKVNGLLDDFGSSRKVNSGWRPKTYNDTVKGASKTSKHITGDAIDLEDADGKLKEWCVFNQDNLIAHGLFMEHPEATPTWVHLQQIPPASGNRIFRP